MNKPSYYSSKEPWSSVFMKKEHEIVAQNIMTILKRTGDEFRELTWEQYEQERMKDGGFSLSEKRYFDEVIPYCTAEKASSFSTSWK